MQDEIIQLLVWMDYRLAVLFTVFIPLMLLIWAFFQKADAIVRLLIIYWRVSSLLAITVYLLIVGWPIAYVSALSSRILIPISLWFWIDLNEEIDDRPATPLKLALTSWRWAMTIYCTLGTIASIPFLRCAFVPGAITSEFCQVLREPPLLFKQYFHAGYTPGFLGFIGMVGLFFYVLYLSYFVLFRLGKQGRSAIEP